MPSVTVTVGSSPKPTCAVSVTPSLSGTTLTLKCSYTLNAINGYNYWGYGIRLQYGTNGTSWSSKNLVSESTSQWSKKTGSFTLTYSSVTSDKKIYFRLASYPDGAKTGSSKSMTIGVKKLTVSKGSNISSVRISTGGTYNLVGASCKVTCTCSDPNGYTVDFNKWTSSNSSVLSNSSSQTYSFKMPNSNITLTASATRTPIKYTIKYIGNGNTGGSTASSVHTYGVAKALTANGFTRTGYTFERWYWGYDGGRYYSNRQSVVNLVHVATTITFAAQWTENEYTVKYNANGGTGSRSTRYAYTAAVSLSGSGFSRTGYQFDGWSKTTTGSVLVAPVSKLTASNGATVNLYAKWDIYTGTLHYYPNGGTCRSGYSLVQSGDYAGSCTATLSFDYNDTARNIANVESLFERVGYHVEPSRAWRVGTSSTYLSEDSANLRGYATSNGNHVKLYANWVINTYTVKYNANGGTGSKPGASVTYTQSVNLEQGGVARTGYTFKGWSLTTNGDVLSGTVSKLTETNGGTVNLYAIWEPNKYTVTYQKDGATIYTDEFTYDAYKTLYTPTEQQMGTDVYIGWANGSTKYSAGSSVKNLSTGDPVTLECLYVLGITGFDMYRNNSNNWQTGTVNIFDGTVWKTGTIKMYLSGGWKV